MDSAVSVSVTGADPRTVGNHIALPASPTTSRTPGRAASPSAPEPAARRHGLGVLAGWAVGLGAAAATAHGLYEVASASLVPAGIAWLYPLITDGVALVAYSATTRFHRTGARVYAGVVVVLAAGLSGLAQAIYLARADVDLALAPAPVRFGMGFWPAIAAMIAAHLIYLMATEREPVAVPAAPHEAAPIPDPVPAASAPLPRPAAGAVASPAPAADPPRPTRPAPRPAVPRAAAAPEPVPGPDAPEREKVDHLQRWTTALGRRPARDSVKRTYRVGSAGADALLRQVSAPGELRRVQ